jgi:hypothetical protein
MFSERDQVSRRREGRAREEQGRSKGGAREESKGGAREESKGGAREEQGRSKGGAREEQGRE